jgi:hypothetical protein
MQEWLGHFLRERAKARSQATKQNGTLFYHR